MTGVVDRTKAVELVLAPAGPGRHPATGLRLAGRLARREVGRRPGRTLLVALMVAVPVAGMVAAAVLVRTAPSSAEAEWRRRFGAADFAGELPATPPDVTRRSGAHTLGVHREERWLRGTAGGEVLALVTDLPVTDPLTAGMVDVRAGRVPRGPEEVLVGDEVARNLHVRIGDRLRLTEPAPLDVVVVGTGALTDQSSPRLLLLGPGHPITALGGDPSSGVLLVGLSRPPTPDDVRYWTSERGLRPAPRLVGVNTGADGGNRLVLIWIVGMVVLAAAGVVIASAFAIGGRRQLMTVGLLGANGAPAPVVRAVLLLQGAITGALGTLAGVGLGAAVLAGGRPHLDRIWPVPPGAYRWQPLDLVPIVVLGLAVSTVAAAMPARTLARVPVRAALAGRWPLAVVPERLTDAGVGGITVGIGLLAAGIASAAPGGSTPAGSGFVIWIAVGATGALLVLLGMSALTPLLVGHLGRVAHRLPGRWRLAARSLARRRAHTAALLAAVCASAALSLAAGSYAAGAGEAAAVGPTEIPLDQVRLDGATADRPAAVPEPVVQLVLLELHDAELLRLTAAGPGEDSPAFNPTRRRAVIADSAALTAYGVSGWGRRQLSSTGVIAAEGTAGAALVPDVRRFLGDVTVVPSADAPGLDTILIEPGRINQLGLVTEPGPVILRSAGPLTAEQRARLGAIDTGAVAIRFTEPRYPQPPAQTEAALAAGSTVVSLLVIAIGLSLAGAEGRRERELLAVNGAEPAVIARINGRKAALVVLAGTALALPVGLLPAWASLDAAGRGPAFAVPWRTVGLLAAAVPLVAGAGTAVASALVQRRRPVTISTMAVD